MNKKTLSPLICVLILFINDLQAQQAIPTPNPGRWSIAASVGAAFPTGKFSGKDFRDSTQSFAKMGLALNVQLHYRLNAHFGVGLLLSGQDNHVAAVEIADQIIEANPGESAGAASGSWKIGKIMAGPTWSMPIGSGGKWDLTARLMAGLLKTAEPSITIVTERSISSGGLGGGSNISESEFYLGKKELSWAFAYQGGIGAAYKIANHWGLRFDLDYAAASVKLPFEFYHGNSLTTPGGPILITGTPLPVLIADPNVGKYYSVPVASVNFLMGIEFRF